MPKKTTYLDCIVERMHLPENCDRLAKIESAKIHDLTDDDNTLCRNMERIRKDYADYDRLESQNGKETSHIELSFIENDIYAAYREIMKLLDERGWK